MIFSVKEIQEKNLETNETVYLQRMGGDEIERMGEWKHDVEKRSDTLLSIFERSVMIISHICP